MTLTKPLFWIQLLLAMGAVASSVLLRSFHPPVQTTALSLLLSATVALSIYLFAVMIQPEKF